MTKPPIPPSLDAPIGERVRYARERRSISRIEMDRAMGSASYTQRLEDGQIRVPSEHRLRELADLLNVEVDWLRGGPIVDEPAVSSRSAARAALSRRGTPPTGIDTGALVAAEGVDRALGAAFDAGRHTLGDMLTTRELLVRGGLTAHDATTLGFDEAVSRLLGAVADLRAAGEPITVASALLRATRLPFAT